jgi:hypothetical protein
MESIDMFSWYALKLVLWAGPLGVASVLAGIAAAAFYAGYSMRPKQPKPMQAAKLDHIKYDILPDGSLGPGDPRGLEGPE